MLDLLTSSDPALVDMFFNAIIRGRRPSAAHQYAAFLTQLLNWKLILTTNFDPLLERALLDQDIEVTNYELTTDSHLLPDATLVRSQRAIIQMHGGAFGLLTGAMLDVPLDYGRKSQFLEYIDHNALLLVIGYGGKDKRVCDLIDSHARRSGTSTEIRVLWLHRTQTPLDHGNVPGIVDLRYQDGAQFLRELHNRLTASHPVSRTWYSALNHVPPRITDADGRWSSIFETKSPVTVYYREEHDYGTSSALAQHVQVASGEFDLIWSHLESLPTINSFVAFLQREFRRRDPALPPFAIFRAHPDDRQHETSVASLPADGEGIDWTADPRPKYILHAMSRGKYILAIDSMGEFGDHLNPGMTSGKDDGAEYTKLQELIEYLIARSAEFGESRIVISSSPRKNVVWPGDSSPAFRHSHDVRRLPVPPPINVSPTGSDIAMAFKVSAPELKESLAKWNEELTQLNNVPERRNIVTRMVNELFTMLNPDSQAVLAIATVFRRFRSIVAFRQILVPIWDNIAHEGIPALANIATPPPEMIPIKRFENTEKLNSVLESLCSLNLIVRQEGGFYWMHRLVRQAIHESIAGHFKSTHRSIEITLHDRLCTYYRDLFSASHDRTSLVEYLYHRYQTLQADDDSDLLCKKLEERLSELDTTLSLERDQLLSQRYSDTLLAWAESFRRLLAEVGNKNSTLERLKKNKTSGATICRRIVYQLMATLCDLKAEAHRQKNDLYRCLSARCEQISHRVSYRPTKPSRTDRRSSPPVHLPPLTAPEEVKKPEGAAIWQQLATRFENEPPSRNWPIVHESHRPFVYKLLEALTDRLFPDFVVKKWCATVGDSKSDPIETAINGYRLLEELVDVAYCASALHIRCAASGSQDESGQAVKSAVDLPDSLLQAIYEALETMLRESKSRPTWSYEVNRARRIMIRCCLRRMEHALRPLTLWNQGGEREAKSKAAKELAGRMYSLGIRELVAFGGVETRDYLHYSCFLNTLMGRAYFLGRDFVSAHRHLDRAEASVADPTTGSEHAALAVCQLHRAECLLFDADFQFSTDHPTNGLEGKRDATRALGRARTMLQRARAAILKGRELLDQGRPHVAWWSRSYWLEAQCCHESLVLWFIEHLLLYRPGHEGGMLRAADWRKCIRAFEIILERAVECVFLSRYSSRQDDRRVKGLNVLTHQLFVCHCLFQCVLSVHDSPGSGCLATLVIQELFGQKWNAHLPPGNKAGFKGGTINVSVKRLSDSYKRLGVKNDDFTSAIESIRRILMPGGAQEVHCEAEMPFRVRHRLLNEVQRMYIENISQGYGGK